ncbi:MAG: hypothetical protein PWR01_172 [Clostridiales bacterium]|jgi:LacI family transcriptional regulator|nr:hypothetical protein [Clostridiales bacterium]
MADVTIKDVAKRAGVSIATVSRVINNNYYVSPEIREKVLRAIEELNYYPNSVARSLKNDSTTHTIGFLVSDISNNYFTIMAKAVEEVVHKEGYSLIVCSTNDVKKRELVYLKLLISKKVDGLILNTTGENDDFIATLSERLPIVLVNRRVYNQNFRGDFIDSDNIEGTYKLVTYLLSMGHRKIGVINGTLSVSTGRERFKGFERAMSEVGIFVDESYPYRYDGDFTMESGYQGAAKMVNMHQKPSAIVIMNNVMAIGALKYFRANNIRVPEDVSIVAYGNIDNSDLLYVQPTIVTLDPWSIGNKAGEMILERIKNRNMGNREVIFVPQLVEGNSVKKL